MNRVKYKLKDALIVEIADDHSSRGPLLMAQKGSADGGNIKESVPLNTKNTIQTKKGIFHKMHSKLGSTAFVWSEHDNNTFITHPHSAGLYHHSSLSQGQDVKCAGMWLVREGKVKYISNSSGHYRNSPERFHELITFLYEKNLVDDDTEICEISLRTELATHKTLSEYFDWSKSNLTLK